MRVHVCCSVACLALCTVSITDMPVLSVLCTGTAAVWEVHIHILPWLHLSEYWCLQEGPDVASAQEVQDLVRREALPEWMGDVLTKNCTNSCASGAIAPIAAEDGEVVTSRERPLPRHQSSLSTSISGCTSIDSDAEVCVVRSP